jgi:cytoskeleton protein RodZ
MDTSGGIANAENRTASQQALTNVGMVLREAREAMGLSVHDIANRIKFAPRQVEALEANDFANLPQATFLRGFVRSYARVLQLDEASLIAALPVDPASRVVARTQVVDVAFPTLFSLQRINLLWLAGALGVALVLGLFIFTRDGESTPKPTEVVVEAVPLPAADAAASAVTGTEEQPQTAETVKAVAPKNQKEQEPVVPPKRPEPVVSQKQPEPVVTPKKAEPVVVPQKRAEPVVQQKKAEPVVQQKKAEPVVQQKKAEPVVQQKKAEPVVLQKKPEPVKAKEPVAKPVPQAVAASAPATDTKSAVPLGSLMRRPLHFVFGEAMFAEVIDARGTTLLSRNVPRGSEKWIGGPGHAPYKISVSNPSKVNLYYKGNPVDLSAYPATGMAHLTLK